jgi:hypothetical protein
MANTSKDKGDRFERAFAKHVIESYPELISVKTPMRHLGAGRKEDVGDMHLFSDAAIQVKAVAAPGTALRSAAAGAIIQAGHAKVPFAVGVVPVFNARVGRVKWLATVQPDAWPGVGLGKPDVHVVEFAMVSKLMTWVSIDEPPFGFRAWPRTERIAILGGGETTPILVSPLEAWMETYRSNSTASAEFRAAGNTWSADE